MESGSAVVQTEERKKKYHIYVEEYVLSYLRREADSLELSEVYFYGSRQDNGRKIFVYGAGRNKEIAAFAKYVPLPELVCRLTQAGPVFMVRESNGECRVNGFEVFYENNEAMQNYLLEWTGSADHKRDEKKDREQAALPVLISSEEKPKGEAHGAISVQLCLVLMVLTAIVITATDSYDKMKQLNQSAKEVFFAIENQEAEDRTANLESTENRDEIVVERDVTAGREPSGQLADTEPPEAALNKPKEEGVLESAGEEPAEEPANQEQDMDAEEPANQEQDMDAEEPANQEQNMTSGEEEGQDASETESEPEEGEEAISRSITRYYEVEQGDTLYTISQRIYGDISRVEEICEVNQITDPDKIRSGQRIILP